MCVVPVIVAVIKQHKAKGLFLGASLLSGYFGVKLW